MKYPYLLLLTALFPALAMAADPDPDQLIRQAFDNWRGKSSYTEVSMTVHRPDWERSMTMLSWTLHDDTSLVRFTAPAKDAGNATLKRKDAMWIYNPRLNQILKLPASMMAQSWMGSDFSYNDLAKANDIITEYTHKLIGLEQAQDHKVYVIEALPKPQAATVWGKQVIRIRDDGVLLGEDYYDQDMQLVKFMQTRKVATLGGRPYPVLMSMQKTSKPDAWTSIHFLQGHFNVAIPDAVFTKSNLRNPRKFNILGGR